MSRVAVALILQFLTRAADLREDPARVFEQARAGVREHDAAAIAFEQILAEFRLQLAHLAAQRRLDHREKRCGTGETAQFRHVAEILELLQIHKPRYPFAY